MTAMALWDLGLNMHESALVDGWWHRLGKPIIVCSVYDCRNQKFK